MTERRRQTWLFFILVLLLSYWNLFRGYGQPARLFWDENYHIASAQKYLHGVFFQELHPPLGKLLIALGEYWLHPNEASDQFLDTMHGTGEQLPENFSFAGYRFFPALLAALSGPLLFGVGYLLFNAPLAAFLLSVFFIFDNALVVHLRGAMLEGPQLFFMILSLLVYLLHRRATTASGRAIAAFGFGAALALAATTKVTSLILCLLFFDAAWRMRSRWGALFGSCALAFVSFLVVSVAVWQIHFALGKEIRPTLDDRGYFGLTEASRGLVDAGRSGEFKFFPVMFLESVAFTERYTRGVPKLNLCKSEENGSPVFFWPLGARSINYLWASNDGKTRYLYLQVNPVVWLLGLCGVLLSASLLAARTFYPETRPLTRGPDIVLFLGLYLAYMIAISTLERVMYLYHYFIPLLFALILFVLSVKEIDRIGSFDLNDRRKKLFGCALVTTVILIFIVYSPLTYFRPVSNGWVKQRSLLSLWDLRCAKCGLVNSIARPTTNEPEPPKNFEKLQLDGDSPLSGIQEWGNPGVGKTADNRPLLIGGVEHPEAFGVHAKTSLMYLLARNYSRFTALAGIPDGATAEKAKLGSIVIEVYADTQLAFRSDIIRGGDAPVQIDIPLTGRKLLKLVVLDAGDGNAEDFAFFAQPTLEREQGR